MRLFYAHFLPEEVQKALREVQARVAPFKGWKPVRFRQLHLTLLFLGERPAEDLPYLRAVGHHLARLVPPFTARLRGTGYFPNEGTPRVWFVKAEGEGFQTLAEGLRAEFSSPDPRPFKPHITLARRKAPAPRVPPVVLDLHWQVETFALVRSELRPQGPVYTVLEEFPLRGEHGREPAENLGGDLKGH